MFLQNVCSLPSNIQLWDWLVDYNSTLPEATLNGNFELFINYHFQIRLEGLKHQVKISVIALPGKRDGETKFRSSNLQFYL